MHFRLFIRLFLYISYNLLTHNGVTNTLFCTTKQAFTIEKMNILQDLLQFIVKCNLFFLIYNKKVENVFFSVFGLKFFLTVLLYSIGGK